MNGTLLARMRTAALLSVVAGLGLMPGVAHAGAGAGTSITFPTTVTVGQSGYPASISLVNFNTGGESGLTNTVCNVSDASPPCGGNGIRLVPSCKLIQVGTCPPAGADPGVFSITQGSGQVGSACAGMIFDVVPNNDVYGSVSFVPQASGHVSLPGVGSTCVINFTVGVLKTPTGDQDPGTPGLQTTQTTDHGQWVGSPPANPNALNSGAQGSSTGTTVLRNAPSITTNASAGVVLGGQLSDQATVSGLFNPVAGATVTFRLYPPGDTDCTGNPVFTDTQAVTLNGTVATAQSAAYTPTAAGVYHWIATYNGDANNLPIAGLCNEASETRTVTTTPPPPPPPPATPPCTPPPGPAPPGGTVCSTPPVVCTPPPGPAPAGGVLCARGTAAIRGRTGCQGAPFSVAVSGRRIQRVVFRLDGRVVRTLTRPNSGSRFVLRVDPRKMRRGTHRVLARTTFASNSGTPARTLRVSFTKCARRAAAPAFTG